MQSTAMAIGYVCLNALIDSSLTGIFGPYLFDLFALLLLAYVECR